MSAFKGLDTAFSAKLVVLISVFFCTIETTR